MEWRHQSRLIAERDRLQEMLAGLRAAATSRADYQPHDVTDDEAALQADAIEAGLVAVEAALDRMVSGEYGCVGNVERELPRSGSMLCRPQICAERAPDGSPTSDPV